MAMKQSGIDFLNKNKERKGVIALPNGLQYEINKGYLYFAIFFSIIVEITRIKLEKTNNFGNKRFYFNELPIEPAYFATKGP